MSQKKLILVSIAASMILTGCVTTSNNTFKVPIVTTATPTTDTGSGSGSSTTTPSDSNTGSSTTPTTDTGSGSGSSTTTPSDSNTGSSTTPTTDTGSGSGSSTTTPSDSNTGSSTTPTTDTGSGSGSSTTTPSDSNTGSSTTPTTDTGSGSGSSTTTPSDSNTGSSTTPTTDTGSGSGSSTDQTSTKYTLGTPSTVNVGNIYSSSYYNSGGKYSNSGKAYEQGWTGEGVKVAVIDSGVQIDHPELIDRNITTYSVVADSSTNDTDGHGTFVIGVIAASPTLSTTGDSSTDIQGVAYNASILSIKASMDENMSEAEMYSAIDLATNLDAKVTNISYGETISSINTMNTYDMPSFLASLRNSLSSDNSLIFSAGNERGGCYANGIGCGITAYIPIIYPDLQNSYSGTIIIVGAVDENGVIADYSNRAGVSAPYYIVAYGGSNELSMIGIIPGSATASYMGTSFAAPIVAGAFSLLAQKYPYLTGKEIRDILFSTATDLGVVGVDEVYGNGLLNIEKAVQPIGTISVVTPETTSLPTSTTHTANYTLGTPSLVDINNIYTNTYNWNINGRIFAGSAYEQGWTGEGVKIAIIDTGVDTAHPELSDRISQELTTVTDEGLTKGDIMGGTFVAGIIGASYTGITYEEYPEYDIFGIAYNSDMMSIKALYDDYTYYDEDIAKALDIATSLNAKVSNFSYSGSGYETIKNDNTTSILVSSIRDALANDNSIIMSAGDGGKTCLSNGVGCGWFGFNGVLFPDLLTNYDGAFIVVGGVDTDNIINSNQAGVMKDFFMVAPSEVLSILIDRGMSYGNSADWATAVVTGSFALLAQKYPYLTGKEIQQILYSTATDLGTAGVDDVYGHGLLDLEKAMKPIGELTIQSNSTITNNTSQNTKSYAGSKLFSSLSFEKELNKVSIGVKDDYNRIFNYPVSNSTDFDDSSYSYFKAEEYKTASGVFVLKVHDAVGVGYKKDDNKYSIVFDESLFGIKGTGAFEMNDPLTVYLNYEKLFDNISAYSSFGMGKANVGKDSVITDISDTYSFGTGIKYTNNNFYASLNVPTSIINGGFNIKTATTRDSQGNVYFNNQNVDLSNSDINLETKIGYNFLRTKNSIFTIEVLNNYQISELNLYTGTLKYIF